MIGLGDLPGGLFRSEAEGVNGDGSIVVGFSLTGVGAEAFIWDAGNGMRNLKTVLETDFSLDLTGWTLANALDISDDGRVIVGHGINPDGNSEGWLVAIPEPRIIGLLLQGIAVLGIARSRLIRGARSCSTVKAA
jgi:probable HAF family extracellular repeat protein